MMKKRVLAALLAAALSLSLVTPALALTGREEAAQVLSAGEIHILVDLHLGEVSGEAYGCDLTYDYVKINGDYRT